MKIIDYERNVYHKSRLFVKQNIINNNKSIIHYNNYWRNRMEENRKKVRCIDCNIRKTCGKLRINKYESKPCKEYVVDLVRAKMNNERKKSS